MDQILSKKVGKKGYYERTDEIYQTCSISDIKKFCALVPSKYASYKSEEWDCDNFAFEFKAIAQRLAPSLPIGYCHVTTDKGIKHALNFVVYENNVGSLSFTFIEPQTGEVKYFPYKPYLMII